ncbi:hypothetical protein FQR65_LT18582 [Abscondita terminalis]|nr:hypothetical protein FQR65_LT18582 [Abscondita terminalis]
MEFLILERERFSAAHKLYARGLVIRAEWKMSLENAAIPTGTGTTCSLFVTVKGEALGEDPAREDEGLLKTPSVFASIEYPHFTI